MTTHPFRACAALALLVTAAGVPAFAQDTGPGSRYLESRSPGSFYNIRNLPEEELKTFYMECSAAAMRSRMGAGEAAECSTAYQTLLTRTFNGDLHSLIAWHRKARAEARSGRLASPF